MNNFILDEFSITQTELVSILDLMCDNILNHGVIYSNEDIKYYLDLYYKLFNEEDSI